MAYLVNADILNDVGSIFIGQLDYFQPIIVISSLKQTIVILCFYTLNDL